MTDHSALGQCLSDLRQLHQHCIEPCTISVYTRHLGREPQGSESLSKSFLRRLQGHASPQGRQAADTGRRPTQNECESRRFSASLKKCCRLRRRAAEPV